MQQPRDCAPEVVILITFLFFLFMEEKRFPLRESELPWALMAYNGVDVEWLRSQPKLVDALCRGEETKNLPIMMKEQFSYDDIQELEAIGRSIPDIKDRNVVEGTLRAYIDQGTNEVRMIFTSRRPFPDLTHRDNVFMGHRFSEEDIFMLLSTNSIGRPVTLTNHKNESFEAFVGIHPITNAMRYMRTDIAMKRIPTEVCGHKFSEAELATLQRGDVIKLTGLVSTYGQKSFDAYYMFSPGTWSTQFLSESAILKNQRNRGVVPYKATTPKEVVGVVKAPSIQGTKEEVSISKPKNKGAKQSI